MMMIDVVMMALMVPAGGRRQMLARLIALGGGSEVGGQPGQRSNARPGPRSSS